MPRYPTLRVKGSDDKCAIPDELRARRHLADIPTKRIAVAMRCSIASVGHFERGLRTPSRQQALAYERVVQRYEAAGEEVTSAMRISIDKPLVRAVHEEVGGSSYYRGRRRANARVARRG